MTFSWCCRGKSADTHFKFFPGEMKNLINNAKYDDIENELRKESERLQKKYKYNPDRDWWLRKQIRK